MALDEERFFYRTGRRTSASLRPVSEATLRPALFAPFADLASLRYDFPVVLVDRPGDARWIEPLSSLIDLTIAEVAPVGSAGERFRRTVLRLEREMRTSLQARAAAARTPGASGTGPPIALEDLWLQAQGQVTVAGGEPATAELSRARQALQARGLFVGHVADCDADLPARLVAHAWGWAEARKADVMIRKISTLRMTLENLLKADYLRSKAGRGAETLAAGVGSPHRELFDFGVMATLLAKPSGERALPATRRRRIDETVAVLREQPFFGAGALPHRFPSVGVALAAWRERQPAMAALVRAIAIAELEAAGQYSEARHDAYFNDFEPGLIAVEERVLFPDYLVTLSGSDAGAAARAQVLEALTGDAPVKILLETGDPFSLGGQLATTAMGLGNVFVLQVPSAHLHTVRDQVLAACQFGGPALISVFNGAFDVDAGLPPYVVSAAALESRVFPAFAYDPAAGPGWPERFALLDNPQPDRPWPIHELAFADENLARASEAVAFTPLDFALCDPARGGHFARVPREHWAGLVSSADWLDGGAGTGAAPYVMAVDIDGRLIRLAVDDSLVREARRVAEAWSRLIQLDQLKREPVRAVETPPGPSPQAVEAVAPDVAGAANPAVAIAIVEAGAGPDSPRTAAANAPATDPAPVEPDRNPDEPYIETWRCTTCNECTAVNARMFAYNENRQAYIKDIAAGSYRDLVNAAETCQVAIIHPGKPRDPDEPGLADLIERAQPFL